MYTWPGLDARPSMTLEERANYERQRAALRHRTLPQTTAVVGIFYLSYAAADIVLLGDVNGLSLVLRFGVVLPMLVLLLIFLRRRGPMHGREQAAIAAAVVCNIVWCVIVTASNSPAALQYYYAAVIFQMVVTIALTPPLVLGMAGSLACFVINYVFAYRLPGADAGYVAHHLAVYLPAVALTLVALHQIEAERIRAFKQIHENDRLKSELARQNGELEALAATDPLTGLPNRRGAALEIERLRLRLAPEELSVTALLLIDIDHFKAYNDGYGHGAGDECLIKVARAMRRELPQGAHLSRHGGEEFLAIVPACDRDLAVRHAECLRRTVRAERIAHGYRSDRIAHVTVSIGAACGRIDNDAALEALLEAADRALYQVKGDGRDGWRLADHRDLAAPRHPSALGAA